MGMGILKIAMNYHLASLLILNLMMLLVGLLFGMILVQCLKLLM